jgi:tetratricopeptide (TPR) repeat protein
VDPQVAQHLKLAAQFAARRTADDTENARKEFEAAIRLAPNNAEAWTGLAEVYSTMSNFGYDDAKPALLKAKTAARRAIELASDSGVAHAVFAYIVSLDLENWRLADPLFVKAVTLDPSQPRTRLWYGAFLGKVGRFPEALSQLQAGLELDPGSMALNQQLVSTHTASRDYPLAIASSEALVRLHPREPSAHLALCNTLLFAGQAAKARLACEESLRLDASPAARAVYASVLAALGRRSEARAIARKVEAKARNVSILADLYHRLGEDEKAVSLLEAAYAVGDSTIQYIGFSPRFDGLSSLPQVQSIRRNLGFTTAARP